MTTRDELLEAVARAICRAQGFNPDYTFKTTLAQWELSVNAADAALSASERAGWCLTPPDEEDERRRNLAHGIY